MSDVKEMPYSEKYSKVKESIKNQESFIPIFLRKYLTEKAVDQLQEIWSKGIKPILKDALDEEKYETAYSNWMWMSSNSFKYIRENLGEEGIEQFKRADVESLKQANASPALLFLSMIRAFSPSLAFYIIAKKTAYQLQWLSPGSVSELTRQRLVINIPQCKILDYPDSKDICYIGCMSIYPVWVSEQFKVEMKLNRQGNSCSISCTPMPH